MTVEDGKEEITQSASVDITGRGQHNTFHADDADDGDSHKSKPRKEDKKADDESQTGDESDDETDDQQGEAGDDDDNSDAGDDSKVDYKKKFSESTKEAQRLLGEIKTAQDSSAQEKAKAAKIAEEMAELRKVAEGKNPEGVQIHDLSRRLEETTRTLALEKEERMLDTFIAGVKIDGASSKKEALRALKRAQPEITLDKLWDEHLKAGVEFAAKAKQDKKTSKKKDSSESGKGTSGRESSGEEQVGTTGFSLKEFNKLPVSKRRALLAKM